MGSLRHYYFNAAYDLVTMYIVILGGLYCIYPCYLGTIWQYSSMMWAENVRKTLWMAGGKGVICFLLRVIYSIKLALSLDLKRDLVTYICKYFQQR